MLKMCNDDFIKKSLLGSMETASKENTYFLLSTMESVFKYLEKVINELDTFWEKKDEGIAL